MGVMLVLQVFDHKSKYWTNKNRPKIDLLDLDQNGGLTDFDIYGAKNNTN